MPAPSLIPIYTTKGDLDAFLAYPYIVNRQGEWVGWVTPDREVYSVHGHYVGFIGAGPRILRKISESFDKQRLIPPSPPGYFKVPALAPLAPMMPELTFGVMDVLDEAPELMPCLDEGELREDMD